MIGLYYNANFVYIDTRSDEICIGHNAIRLSDRIYSAMTENITKAAPIDNERFECTYAYSNITIVLLVYTVVTSSVPDSDNDHNENGMCVLIFAFCNYM